MAGSAGDVTISSFGRFVVIVVVVAIDVIPTLVFVGSSRSLERSTVALIAAPTLAYVVARGAHALFVLLRGQAKQ